MKNATDRILAKMFDSKLPRGSIKLSHGELEVEISTYHALAATLYFDEVWDRKYKRWLAKFELANSRVPHTNELIQLLPEDKSNSMYFGSTANEDNLFSESFLYGNLNSSEEHVVLLERGDYYFSPKRMRAFDGDLPSNSVRVGCRNSHEWSGDYHLRQNNPWSPTVILQEMPTFDLRSRTLWLDGSESSISKLTLAQAVAIQAGHRHISGIITVDGDVVMCPVCGSQLHAEPH